MLFFLIAHWEHTVLKSLALQRNKADAYLALTLMKEEKKSSKVVSREVCCTSIARE